MTDEVNQITATDAGNALSLDERNPAVEQAITRRIST